MTRIIATGCDLETTGFQASKGHRIVEICLSMWDVAARIKLRHWTFRVNPLRDIPAAASNVHKIYTEDLVDAPTWEKVAPAVNAVLQKTDLLVCHNVGFDGPFLGEELLRVGQRPPNVPTFCTMENARWATGTGKNPKLAELAWALKVPFDPNEAHAADYDVDAMMKCLWSGMDRGLFKLPIAIPARAA